MNVNKHFTKLISEIGEENNLKITEISSLSGGDINNVFLVDTEASGKRVIKINLAEKYPGMFEAEKEGLQALAAPKVIDVPEAIATGQVDEESYLLLEYKAPGRETQDFWEKFGAQMAALHKNTSDTFGFGIDNYIGSLPQYNTKCSSASEFYITQRLEPQFKMARDSKYELGNIRAFLNKVPKLIPEEPPALIHGDLWNGNYLVNIDGLPCLIDPATAYAPREMDLAMMKLFGGFNDRLFNIYNEKFPLEEGFEDRIKLWQLYYLLVHLNLFGSGYLNSVTGIIKRYL
ncbi:fructosamine kinase family protein [Salegentibacter chungangensis]|uniref:Fructosamine kinase family protein n=1 Tax=Salegentibacter chungangensis TaxID=1335724 RepID=A0ABW3NPQ1_9FLAO